MGREVGRTGSDDLTRPGTQSAPVLKLGGERVLLEEGRAARVRRREVDLCFVFDTTGSMANKIDGLVGCMDSLVAGLGRLALDWRVTTVPFGDLTVRGDRVVEDLPFATDVDSASRQLASMERFFGGDNLGESSVEAMLAACRKPYRPDAVKILVLLTDEPALGHEQGAPAVDGALAARDAACFTVSPDLPYYRDWAERHGGEWRPVATAVDTTAIMALFTSLLDRVVEVADSVHRLGDGSVQAYLERGGAGAA